jgi:PAS domain S-box-containing protein
MSDGVEHTEPVLNSAADLAAENERLRAQVETLRQQLALGPVVTQPEETGPRDGTQTTSGRADAAYQTRHGRSRRRTSINNQDYRAIVESAVDYAIITIGLDGVITGWNKAAEAILGWTDAEAIGQSFHLIFTPADRAAGVPEAEMQGALIDGKAADNRWHLKRDGSRFWSSGQLTPLRNHDLRGYVKILRDSTDEQLVAERLQASEAEFRLLIETIPQLVFRAQGRGAVTWVSSQWLGYTGLSAEDSLRQGWLEAVHPSDRVKTIEAWEQAEHDGTYFIEHRIRRGLDDAYRWFQSRAALVRGGDAQIFGWVGASTDIDGEVTLRELLQRSQGELETQVATRTADLGRALIALRDEAAVRGRAEEALRHGQKMEAVGQLTGGIAHDFNNMLQGIAGSLEIGRMRLEQGRNDDAVRFLGLAQETVDRAASLTRRLLAFARRQRLDSRPIDPDGLIAGLADLIRRTMGPGIQVELSLRDGRGSVICDQHELESTLINLCINARDAMPDGGRLLIKSEDKTLTHAEARTFEGARAGDYVVLGVRDTGTGMTPDVLKQAVEPFFTTKPTGQGTGLGLSQVYGFVRQSGGFVTLESTVGAGTFVGLYLPRSATPAEQIRPPVTQAASAHAGAGEIILMVDDEATVRHAAAERLREAGYHILEAGDGQTALRILENTHDIAMLITDVGLPGMNGRQLAESVRQIRPQLPVLFITGYPARALPSDIEVIDKPFELDDLLRKVQAIMAAADDPPRPSPGRLR